MLSCSHIAQHASDYIDQDVSLFQRLKIRWHLRACIHCSRLVRHLQITLGYTRKLDRQQASLQEAEAVLEKVLAAESNRGTSET